MNKLKNLFRISLKNKIILFFYYLFKAFKLKNSPNQKQVNELYHHLIYTNGVLISENDEKYKVKLLKSASNLSIRKYPSSDLNVFGQVFRGNEYKKVTELYKEFFGINPQNIIDAGGNVGYTSVYFKNVFSDANLAIIEPSDANFAMIQDNFALNEVEAKLFKGGLWDKNTNLKIVRDFRDQSDWSIRVEETEEESDLKAFTVDFVMKESGFKSIDIFKIDIEGAEKQIFGKSASISFLKSTKCLALEIHDEFDCRKDIVNLLERYGFKLVNVGELTIGINQNLISL
jgi:FkbM family methyltransferase